MTLNTDSTPAVSSTAGPRGAQRETHVGRRQREGSQVRRGGEVRCKGAGSHVVHLGPSFGTWHLGAGSISERRRGTGHVVGSKEWRTTIP